MGKYDKDRFQKELAIRFCLSRRMIPFIEVITNSSSDLSDSSEVLTDLDVAGVELSGSGSLRWSLFDCKSSGKLSGINRAFWARGVIDFVGYDQGYVLLKNRPVNNHRLSALKIDIDLHSEKSFRELGKTFSEDFANDKFYQSSIDRWEKVFDAYDKYTWSKNTFNLARNTVPVSKLPWNAFRRVLAELRACSGEYDPSKIEHTAIYWDLLASVMVLWAFLNHDIRRFYDPDMNKEEFEKILRYYFWGGRENYEIMQKMRELSGNKSGQGDLPVWSKLVNYASITVSAPDCVLECAHICRELSIRCACSPKEEFDKEIENRFKSNNRLRQFISGMNNYLTEAGSLPMDMAKEADKLLFSL